MSEPCKDPVAKGRGEISEEMNGGTVASTPTQQSPRYPSMAQAILIMIALYTTMYLVFLMRHIDHCDGHSADHGRVPLSGRYRVVWKCFLLTASPSQLMYGNRIYTFYPAKWVLLACITIFEVGFVVCGAAASSATLIIGRAVAGIGTGGIVSGTILVIILTSPPRLQPIFQILKGRSSGLPLCWVPCWVVFFTKHLMWRWCFYINLPFNQTNLRHRLLRLDPLGNLVLIPNVVCLLLALKPRSSSSDWSGWRPVLLLVLNGLLFRCVLVGVWWTTCTAAAMKVMLYSLPIWFQAICKADAERSPSRNGRFLLLMVVAGIGAGVLVSTFGQHVNRS
ncbi:hypothetical protein CNMCM5623_003990 [Aspergillus felis]|uniref:Uncharacterized protein n=1 Tax=Aspergillus felis TaxID=1287682 RepID=A0A8H6QZZ9_9EURO|nr:hypothetical protein CNMCM5623_003990 [Aspergillus felis]KAF7183361.1 hypothetical protein CNMCM7691_003560 [Aspergillus felis]